MMRCPGLKHKALVAIGAFHSILVAHFQEDAGMAQRAAAAVTGDAGVVGFDDFGGLDRHGNDLKGGTGGIIQVKIWGARARVRDMVTLNKIYTKTGDSGETGLGDGSRISKTSPRIAAIGAVDETNSAIGIARLDAEGDIDTMLARIQNDLFDLGADLGAPEDGRKAEGRLAHRAGAGRAAGARDRRDE